MIRTVPSQMYYTPQWFKRMERWLGESSLQPLVNLVQHHETSYSAIQQFIEKPPGKLRIIEVYPPKPLHSMALGSRIPALREDYKTGRLCGRYFLATVGKLLAATPPLLRHTSRIAVPETVVVPPAARWPMIRMWRRSLARRRQTTPHLPTRIWRELALYRYALPF